MTFRVAVPTHHTFVAFAERYRIEWHHGLGASRCDRLVLAQIDAPNVTVARADAAREFNLPLRHAPVAFADDDRTTSAVHHLGGLASKEQIDNFRNGFPTG